MLHQGNLLSIPHEVGILNGNQKFIQKTAELGHGTEYTGDTQPFPARLLSTNNNSQSVMEDVSQSSARCRQVTVSKINTNR